MRYLKQDAVRLAKLTNYKIARQPAKQIILEIKNRIFQVYGYDISEKDLIDLKIPEDLKLDNLFS